MKAVVFFLAGALLAAVGPRTAGATAAVTFDPAFAMAASDSTAAVSDSVSGIPQRDVFDFLNEHLLHRQLPNVIGEERPIGLQWAVLPTLSYNPVYGLAVGAMISGAGWRASESLRFSQLAISGSISTTGQIQAQVRGDLFRPSGNYLLKMDVRYLDTKRSTWGLGPISPDQQEYPMEFALVRLYATAYRRAGGAVFIGFGYHYDEFGRIVDSRAQAGEATPFTVYSGSAPASTVASGLSINVLGDTRDNLANPSSGYFLSGSFRNYMPDFGSDGYWQEMWIEMRAYPRLPNNSRNVLGFWLSSWLTFGETPYLNLPSNGWDTYGRSARGYLQGRIRGVNQLYLETEYRRVLTRDGLWGAVAFLNTTITTEPESGIFGAADLGGGIGLRIKFNKRSNANLAIDYGWGKSGSKGFFLGMSEVF
jgi:hypothetical protein